MTSRRTFGWTYNQGAKTKAAEALERSCCYAAAAAEMSRHGAEPLDDLLPAREDSQKRTRHVGNRDELAFVKSLASDDDILAGLIKQQELVDSLVKLLEISDASVNKATGLVEQLMGDNAKASQGARQEGGGGRQLEDAA